MEIDKLKKSNIITVLYLSSKGCNVCNVLRPKLEKICDEYIDVDFYYIDLDENSNLSGELMVFNVPTIILNIHEKEYKRYSRSLGVEQFKKDLDRYLKLLK